jgi:hypothetical protein
MWNAWTAPPGARPSDYDPWSCEAHCARCGELAQDCHCDEDEELMADRLKDSERLVSARGALAITIGRYQLAKVGTEKYFELARELDRRVAELEAAAVESAQAKRGHR